MDIDQILKQRQDLVIRDRRNQLETTRRLWYERKSVMIPRYALHDKEYLDLYGTYTITYLNKMERLEAAKTMVKCQRTVISQVKLFNEGIPIAYTNRDIAVEVYMMICQHIDNWTYIRNTSMYGRANLPPSEDFEILQEFSQYLEKFLLYYYDKMDRSRELSILSKHTQHGFGDRVEYVPANNETGGIFTTNKVPRIDKPLPVENISKLTFVNNVAIDDDGSTLEIV